MKINPSEILAAVFSSSAISCFFITSISSGDKFSSIFLGSWISVGGDVRGFVGALVGGFVGTFVGVFVGLDGAS